MRRLESSWSLFESDSELWPWILDDVVTGPFSLSEPEEPWSKRTAVSSRAGVRRTKAPRRNWSSQAVCGSRSHHGSKYRQVCTINSQNITSHTSANRLIFKTTLATQCIYQQPNDDLAKRQKAKLKLQCRHSVSALPPSPSISHPGLISSSPAPHFLPGFAQWRHVYGSGYPQLQVPVW